MEKLQKITPFLWFDNQAEEAANFYVSIFKNSKIGNVVRNNGAVLVVDFSLDGQKFNALNGGPQFQFNEAVSFVVHCDTQDEVDYFWEKLTAGGEESMCGWLRDKFGLSWQIVPDILPKLLSDPDPAKAQTAMAAMMQMRKIVIADLSKMPEKTAITVENTVDAPVEKVWRLWTEPEHILHWNNASDDWHTPKAVNDLRAGGHFSFTMAAKDGSFRFDFAGMYNEVIENQRIAYTIADGRKVEVTFKGMGDKTKIIETFEAENMNSPDMQRQGWQAILDNFKKYAER